MNWNADVAALNIRTFFSARESKNLDDLADDLKPAVSEIRSDPWILFLLDVLDFDTATKVANHLRCPERLHFEWKLKYELVFALRKKKHMCLRFRDLGWESLRAHPRFRAYVAAAATPQKRELDLEHGDDDDDDLRYYVTLTGSREYFPESTRFFAAPPVIISVSSSDDDGDRLAGLRFYLRIVYNQETSVLTKLIAMKTNASVSAAADTPPTTSPSRDTLSLDAAQLAFIDTVMRTDGGVHILTGGAGTGKTRTIMGLLQRFDQRTYVCAPTGKAISNIRQKLTDDNNSLLNRYECGLRDTYDFKAGIIHFEDETGHYEHESIYLSTIHRVLCSEKDARQFGDASLVVIDEFSMVDLRLFSRVLARVKKRHVRLVLVGDDNQLYPVSYGKVMKDLIDSRHIVSSLTQLAVAYRQQTTTTTTSASFILQNASALLAATPPTSWRAILTTSPTFQIHLRRFDGVAATLWDEVCSFVVDEHRRCRGVRRLQVLCQTNNLCDNINRGVQEGITRYGVDGDAEMYVPRAKLFVRRNDPLICVKNFYEDETVYYRENISGAKPNKQLKYANGDPATVVGWKTRRVDNTSNKEVLYITVEHNTDSCVQDWAEDEFAAHFKLGYAITIHKSQGSEYDAGVVVLDARCRWFAQRSMLYTAKKACFVFAHEDDLDAAVNAPMHLFVFGALQDRLLQHAATTQS